MSNRLMTKFTHIICGESGFESQPLHKLFLVATNSSTRFCYYLVIVSCIYGFNVGRWFRLPHVSQIFHLAYCNDCFLVLFFFWYHVFQFYKTCFLFLTALENMLTSGTGWIQNLIYFFNNTKVLFLKMRCFIILEFNDGDLMQLCTLYVKLFQTVNPPSLNS